MGEGSGHSSGVNYDVDALTLVNGIWNAENEGEGSMLCT